MRRRCPISLLEATHCSTPLLAYDGSPAADRALETSIELAAASHGRLTILSAVVQIPYIAYTGAASEAVAELRNSFLRDAERVICRAYGPLPVLIVSAKPDEASVPDETGAQIAPMTPRRA